MRRSSTDKRAASPLGWLGSVILLQSHAPIRLLETPPIVIKKKCSLFVMFNLSVVSWLTVIVGLMVMKFTTFQLIIGHYKVYFQNYKPSFHFVSLSFSIKIFEIKMKVVCYAS